MTESPLTAPADTREVGLDDAYESLLRVHQLVTTERGEMVRQLCNDPQSGVTEADLDTQEDPPMSKEQFTAWVAANRLSPATVKQWMTHLAAKVSHDPTAEKVQDGEGVLAN